MLRVFPALVLLLVTAAAAQDRTLVVDGVLNAPPREVFDSFTTPEGIVKAWGVAKAKVDFRQGGQIRTAYDPDADLDSPRAIVNTILAYEPGRMLAIKATAPEGAPDWLRAICETGFSVIRLEDAGPGRTRLVITGLGYREGPLFDTAYEFFEKGNAATLAHMQQVFGGTPAPDEARRAHELLASLVGGTWRKAPGEGELKDATVHYSQPMPPFIIAGGALDLGQGLTPHGHCVFAPDPAAGACAFWNFDDKGNLARGHARLIAENRLVLNWDIQSVSGEPKAQYHADIALTTPDEYLFRVFPGPVNPDRTDEPMVRVVYRRSP